MAYLVGSLTNEFFLRPIHSNGEKYILKSLEIYSVFSC